MCFHNSMSAKAIKVAARYGRQSDVVEIYQSILDEQYHVNAFTFPRYPIITSSDEVQVFNWGLIPFWVRSEEDATEIRKTTVFFRFIFPSSRFPPSRVAFPSYRDLLSKYYPCCCKYRFIFFIIVFLLR